MLCVINNSTTVSDSTHSLVEKLRPFPGMQHLDVAGGTGDVAMRVLRAIRAAELQQPQSPAAPASQATRTQKADSGSSSSTPSAQSEPAITQAPGIPHSSHASSGSSPTYNSKPINSSGHLDSSAAQAAAAQIPLSTDSTSQTKQQSARGAVTVFDINAEMLEQGQKRVQGTDLAGGDCFVIRGSWVGAPKCCFDCRVKAKITYTANVKLGRHAEH